MALSKIAAARKTFAYNGETFSIRGVSMDDVTRVILDDQAEVEKAMDLIDQSRGEDGEVNIGSAIVLLVQKAPKIAAKIAACAADEPEAWTNFLSLPAPIQLDVLMGIGELTFSEPDALKKFVANLVSLLAQVKTLKS